MLETRQRIIALLGWTEETLNNFYIDQAREFLRLFYQEDSFPIEAFYICDIFWKWWKNEWFMRDSSFLYHLNTVEGNRIENLYTYMHSAQYLNKKPQRPVMEQMMEVVNRELQKELQAQNAAVYAVQALINETNKQTV